MTDATELARDVTARLLGAGVREVVLAPGSRNAPLAFALHDAAEAGLVRLHTRIDERTAGFLALGLAKVSRRPVVVTCTSGTAVANLLPAVLEASHAGIPLIALTADRPASARGTGASQTTDQVGVFGTAAAGIDLATPDDLDALAELLTDQTWSSAPLHVNVQLSPPLVPANRWAAEPFDLQIPMARRERMPRQVEMHTGPRTAVVAGDDAGPRARVLAEAANWPLLAEPTSGSRTGDNAIRTYRLLLDGDMGSRIQRVVVAGHPTLSRPVARLLEREDVEVISVAAAGRWPERPFPVDRTVAALSVAGADDPAWLEEWHAADRDLGRRLDALLHAEGELTPHHVAGAVARALPAGGLLLVGASNPIRDLDLMVPRYEVGARRLVIANRGLAGIDGTVSTAVGAALGRPHSTRALALMGDVTFVHDLTGLVLGVSQAAPDLTIVVVNDDGGSIFASLEQGAPDYADRYDALFGTPHGVDLAAVCAATRTAHLRVTSLPELEQALASPNGGVEVVEAVVRRDNRRELDARIRALSG